MMKKFKAILTAVVAFVAVSVLMVGCGSPTKNETPSEPTTTTISLADAKAIIVQALSLDTVTPSALQTYADTDTGNRDIMEKMQKFALDICLTNSSNNDATMIAKSNMVGEYSDNNLAKYLNHYNDPSTKWDEYYATELATEDVYFYSLDDELCNAIPSNESVYNYSNINCNPWVTASTLAHLFDDDSFDHLYQDNVIRTDTIDGFDLTLSSSDFKSYFYYQAKILEEFQLFDKYWETYEEFAAMWETIEQGLAYSVQNIEISLTLHFTEDGITAVEYFVYLEEEILYPDYTYNFTNELTIALTKTDAVIEQPQWVTDYLNSQAA